jgi:hypothetical protein
MHVRSAGQRKAVLGFKLAAEGRDLIFLALMFSERPDVPTVVGVAK